MVRWRASGSRLHGRDWGEQPNQKRKRQDPIWPRDDHDNLDGK